MIELILMLAGAGVVYFGIEYLYKRKWDKKLDADIRFSTGAACPGDEIELYEVITNKKKLPLPVLNVKIQLDRKLSFEGDDSNSKVSDYSYKNDVFCVHGNERITRTIPIKCEKRGFFRMNRIELVCSGAFMGDILHKAVPCDSALVVYPKQLDARNIEVPYRKIMGEVLVDKRLYEDPFEFAGIREYQPFDTMNSVNWNATARTGDLKVNVHGNSATQEVVILLNLENEGMQVFERLQETCISLASSLAGYLLKSGVSVGMITNGKDLESKEEVVFEAGSSSGHIDTINYALSRINLALPIDSFDATLQKNKARISDDAIVVLVSYARREKMIEEYKSILAKGAAGVWVLPYTKSTDWNVGIPGGLNVVPWEVNPYD